MMMKEKGKAKSEKVSVLRSLSQELLDASLGKEKEQ